MTTLVAKMPAAAPSLLQRLIEWNATRRVYRQTLNELSQLSPRGLQDLGLAPGDLHRIAQEAAAAHRAGRAA